LVIGLGSAQLVAWGTLYYSIAILGEPMRAELGAATSDVFGAFTCGMVVCGVLAPWAGRCIDRYGGRAMLAASAVAGALAFAVLAHARSLPQLIAGWSIAGAAMSFGLYDACFAAIGQVQPTGYRTVVTSVTLIAGFASTAFWPLSHYLLASMGWRGVCEAHAVALLLCAPIYLAVLPKVARGSPALAPPPIAASIGDELGRKRARLLSWSFAGASLISASMSAHLVAVLGALRVPSEQAVWIASSIGVLQVLGRVLELLFGTRLSATQLGLVCFGGLAVAMTLLLSTAALPALVLGFALFYGVTNGLLTIAKATLPVELLGFANVGSVLGSFGAPSQVARALAPLGFALLASASTTQGALGGTVVVALLSLSSFAFATRR
jgi:hypothetical protein